MGRPSEHRPSSPKVQSVQMLMKLLWWCTATCLPDNHTQGVGVHGRRQHPVKQELRRLQVAAEYTHCAIAGRPPAAAPLSAGSPPQPNVPRCSCDLAGGGCEHTEISGTARQACIQVLCLLGAVPAARCQPERTMWVTVPTECVDICLCWITRDSPKSATCGGGRPAADAPEAALPECCARLACDPCSRTWKHVRAAWQSPSALWSGLPQLIARQGGGVWSPHLGNPLARVLVGAAEQDVGTREICSVRSRPSAGELGARCRVPSAHTAAARREPKGGKQPPVGGVECRCHTPPSLPPSLPF